jgi:hypothetical protein
MEMVVGSSLWRSWSLLVTTGRSVPTICEIGEQGGFDWSDTKVCNSRGDRLNSLTMKDELPNEKAITLWLWLSCVAFSGMQGRKVVTWLILPVVICLSQRLSHACLSINKFVLWNCEWLIKSVIVYLMLPCYMDNCGNSRANTCNQAPTSGRGVFIR